jgi:multiple antibiotic resistance protein
VAFIILSAFTISGQYLFQFFGISTNGFRIAGGFIIFKIGYDMLQAHFTHIKLNEQEQQHYANNISITPLAIPMLCGPGAIANGIVLMEDADDLLTKAVLIAVICLVFLVTYAILRASTRLVKLLGETGNNVLMRLMGLILMVIAVECFVSGIRPILTDILKQSMA